MLRKTDLSDEEWRLLREAPARAWAAIESIAPSSPQGVMKEFWALGIGLAIAAERAHEDGPPLLADLLEAEQSGPVRLSDREASASAAALDATLRDVRAAARLLWERGADQERAAYAALVHGVAERIARAHAEAGASGPDGRGINSAEAAFLRALAGALQPPAGTEEAGVRRPPMTGETG